MTATHSGNDARDVPVEGRGKRPVAGLAGPYGHPLHPMLVPVPIGAWSLSLATDIASRVVDDRPWLAEASWWLLAIGIVGALAAATLGFLDLLAIPTRTRAYRIALAHMTANLLATSAFGASLAMRGTYDDVTGAVATSHLAVSAGGLALLGLGGFLGGELAFRYGVRVTTDADQAHAFHRPADRP